MLSTASLDTNRAVEYRRLSFMPLVQYLVFPTCMYGIFLNFLAVKAVHQFGWKKTITSVLIPVTLGGIVIITIIAIVISGILVMQSLSGINDYEGEDYDTLVEALNQRWENEKNHTHFERWFWY